MFRRIVAHQKQVRVGHIGLEAKRLRHSDGFQEIKSVLPTVQARPADLALGGQAFAVVGGNLGRFAERLGDFRGVCLRVFTPFFDPELSRVDPNRAVFAHAVIVEYACDAACHAHGVEKFLASHGIAHRRIAHGASPDRRDKRTDVEAVPRNQVGDFFQFVVAGVRIGVRQKKEVVNPIELLAVNLRAGGQFEHPFETDRWLLALFISFAHQPGPHGVVKFWEGIRTHLLAPFWFSSVHDSYCFAARMDFRALQNNILQPFAKNTRRFLKI